MSSALEFDADFDRMLQNRIGPLIKYLSIRQNQFFRFLTGGTWFIPVNVNLRTR